MLGSEIVRDQTFGIGRDGQRQSILGGVQQLRIGEMTGGPLFLLMLQVGHHLLLLLLLRVFKVASQVMVAHSGPGQSQIVQNVPLLHGEMALGFHQQQVVVVVVGGRHAG